MFLNNSSSQPLLSLFSANVPDSPELRQSIYNKISTFLSIASLYLSGIYSAFCIASMLIKIIRH